MKQVVKKTIHCKVDAETAYRHSVIFEAKHQTAKCRLMRELSQTSQLPYTLVTGKLNITAATIRSLADAGLIEVTEENVYRKPVLKSDLSGKDGAAKQLSAEQQAVVDAICANTPVQDNNGTVLAADQPVIESIRIIE